MKRRVIAVGPGAASLILVVVALCMSVLGMLTLISARNDYRFSARSRDMTETTYAMNGRAEESLARLDGALAACAKQASNDPEYLSLLEGALPEGMQLDGREVFWQEIEGERVLDCAVNVSEWGAQERFSWKRHCLSVQMEEYDSLWN